MTAFKYLGTLSHGTMRIEDLLPAFADMLEKLCNENPAPADAKPDVIYMGCGSKSFRDLIADARNSIAENKQDGWSHPGNLDCALNIQESLYDALDSFAPDYCYFGAHPNDGADYGFWPHDDFMQMMRDDGVAVLDAGDPNPANGSNVAFVSDHGNVSYGYVAKGEFVECWSVV